MKLALRPERLREFGLLIVLVGILLFFSTQITNYLTPRTFNRISGDVMIILVVAVGQTLVVLTRNIDLSVGSIVGFCAYFVGRQIADYRIEPLSAVLLALALGGLLGAINGLLVAYGRIPAIVTTLGTLAVYRGILVEFAGAKTVTTATLPEWLNTLNPVVLFEIGEVQVRLLVAVAILIVLVFNFVLLFLPFGRRLYAIGSNPDAAKFAGIPARRTILLAYILCGALAGIGGFIFLARFGNITVVAAQGLELQVIAAVVVGGVNIFGGSGTMFGVALGAIIIATIEQSLVRLQISEFWKDASLGLFILLAVTSDTIIFNRVRDWLALRKRKQEMAARAARETALSGGV
ncbi:MAG: ABC transporter permease [Anaerolineae bacterium]